MASKVISKDRARNNAAAYSVIAIAILIAIPAVIAYAEDSDATNYIVDNDATFITSKIQYWQGGSTLSTDPVILKNGFDYSTHLSSSITVSSIHLQMGASENNTQNYHTYDRFVFASDLEKISAVKLIAANNSWNTDVSWDMKYDAARDYFYLDLNTMDKVLEADNINYKFAISFAEPVTISSFEYSIRAYNGEEIFSDDVINAMFLISGLMLIVFSLFATPWISVSKVTRTTRRAARSVSNGAKKATRSVKRSVKKR